MWQCRSSKAGTVSLLNAVIESTADGILVVDRAWKIVHYNRKFLRMWRIPDSVIAARDDSEAIAFVQGQLRYPEQFASKIREVYGSADDVILDTLEFKDGRVFERYSQPYKLGDQYMGRVWSFRDVTQRLAFEREREARIESEKLARLHAEEAARLREDLVAMVSHDLKNPVSGILAAVNILQRIGCADARGERPLAIIRRAADHMNQMVQDLLDAYTTESGGYGPKIAMERSVADARALIREAIEALQIIAAEKSIRLEMEAREDLPPVSVHAALMGHVFQNLIGNALKFSTEGARVLVRAECAGPEVVFSVKDTGPGIDESFMPALFVRFAREKRVTGHGTGLGLVIAKGIVEAHGGRIWAESKVGAGSTFFFTVPACSGPATVALPA